jgi:hypothetical protein
VGKLVGYSVGGVVGIQVGLYEGRLVDGSEVGAFVGSELEGEAVLGVTVLGAEVLHCVAPRVEEAKAEGTKNKEKAEGMAYDGAGVATDGVGVLGAEVGLQGTTLSLAHWHWY